MTIIANGNVVMTAVLPGVHVLLHDVAIYTRFRVVAQIAGSASVAKGESPDASEQSD